MSRIKEKFAELEAKNQKALISYIMAGFPNEKSTMSTVKGLIKGGIDIIELGFPFSDPLADGPVIQNASTVSLEKGTKIANFFTLVKKIRKETDTPLVLMTYTNILYHRGYSEFIAEAKKAGIDGFILPDMSVEESKEYLQAAKNNADTIFLISPNTSNTRIQKISKASTGFLYLVAVFGTTGVKTGIKKYTIDAIKQVKKQTKGKIPIGVGFGISTPDDVKKYIRAGADAVIVGSAYLKLIEKTPQNQLESKVATFTKSLKKQTIL
ncbi:MAG: tryptophan synthase subunit alpha [Nitrosopumilus sp.]|uniref:tryptophan synthase subunit alpha n=1 Tax=Nitrosopumilus sp. TaxID=2024843 RepID=UPI0024709119|nr:tryptophan synthase subunit alpha [Nitrosopumilus sp.]MDH5431069.1 tryptophan synthase subunit alpha [Nitrosopumilus sp.]MDH5665755.1 tryptophan synthase subunit alpha [Nitrosopumilus sp.]